jgi:hypothetical protein
LVSIALAIAASPKPAFVMSTMSWFVSGFFVWAGETAPIDRAEMKSRGSFVNFIAGLPVCAGRYFESRNGVRIASQRAPERFGCLSLKVPTAKISQYRVERK